MFMALLLGSQLPGNRLLLCRGAAKLYSRCICYGYVASRCRIIVFHSIS